MKNIIPKITIITVAIILIALNELTQVNFVKDYYYLFIIGAILAGFWLEKQASKP